jgi:glutathione synthase
MKLLFIADPLDTFKIYKDSTFAMMAEASRRGAQVFACEVHDVFLHQAQGKVLVSAQVKQIKLNPLHMQDRHLEGPWYEVLATQEEALSTMSAVVMRKDPPFDAEFLYATYLLERAQAQGAKVFNDPRALRDHNEKLGITEFPEFTAPTLVTRDAQRLRAFVHEHETAVLKLLDGMGGASIFLARANDPNLSVILETMNQFGARSVMAQRYLPQIAQGDKRILLIDGKPAPYALARIPKAGESRGNLAAGGRAQAQPLSARDLEIAHALGPRLAKRGLLLVGLDVIGDSLTEVNVTSPTCFQEIADQTGFSVAGMFMDALEAQIGAG